MKMNTSLLPAIFTLLLLSLNAIQASGYKTFTGIHDTIPPSLANYVEKAGLGKVTYYFDNKKQKDGEWQLYPSSQISAHIVAVNISTIPNQSSEYTFIVIIDTTNWTITDTLGPFYDSYVNAISTKVKNSRIEEIKVRLINPPEPNESKFTIVEYLRKDSKLIKTKSHDRN